MRIPHTLKQPLTLDPPPVERYSPLDGCWAMCPPMLTARENPGCAVFLDRLYVAGGRDELLLELSTVEKFDPEAHRWTPVRPMRSKRHQVGGFCRFQYFWKSLK